MYYLLLTIYYLLFTTYYLILTIYMWWSPVGYQTRCAAGGVASFVESGDRHEVGNGCIQTAAISVSFKANRSTHVSAGHSKLLLRAAQGVGADTDEKACHACAAVGERPGQRDRGRGTAVPNAVLLVPGECRKAQLSPVGWQRLRVQEAHRMRRSHVTTRTQLVNVVSSKK